MLFEHEHHSSTRLQSTGWIIDARWYYAFLAFFLGLIARDENVFPNSTIILAVSLFVVLASNLYYYFYLKRINHLPHIAADIDMLNVSQITIDLAFFFIIMLFTGGGVESSANSFSLSRSSYQ